MRNGRLGVWGSTARAGVGLLALMLVVGAASCGGGGAGEAPVLELVVKAEDAAVGETIISDAWEVTLLDAPEQMERVGNESMGDLLQYMGEGTFQGGQSLSDVDVTAKGVYIVCGIEIVNISDEAQYLSTTVLKVVDSAGEEYFAEGRVPHVVYVWITERWMDKSNELIPGVMEIGEPREGPVIFDVPEDATGLVLMIEGADGTIDLGF